MYAPGADLAGVTVVVNVFREEQGVVVARPEGLELLEYAEEFRGDAREIELGVDRNHGRKHILRDLAVHERIDAAAELCEVLLLEGESCGIYMAAEILEKIGAALDGLVQVEALDAAGRAGDEAVGLGQHDGRLVEGLNEPRGNDADDTLVPLGIVYDRGILPGEAFAFLDHLEGFLGNLAVDALAVVVVLVDLLAYGHGGIDVGGGQEFDREATGLHATGGIDARADLEDDIVYGNMSQFEFGQGNHGKQAGAGRFVQLLEAVVSQYAVLPHYRHQVGGYADDEVIEQRDKAFEGNAVAFRIRLDEFETHSAS